MQVIGTAGHVDHGKSTLVERLTGIDPDRWAEEKRRGLTIDLGFAWLPLPSGREVGLIDVPGHERFIKNMLAGAGGITVCMFVVAANEGWMPQSSEHLAILDVLGVAHGVVAVTKADTVSADDLDLVIRDVRAHIGGTTLENAPVIPCSAVTGMGLEELLQALDAAVAQAPPAPDLGRPRLWIDRLFTISGAGTVITGTLGGGSLTVGDRVDIAPEGRRARIRGIQSHKRALEEVGPGNRVALNLSGLDKKGAQRGDAVVKPGTWHPTRLVGARVRVLPAAIVGAEHKLIPKGAHLLYAGSAESPVRVHLLDANELRSGQSGFAQLRLRDPLPLVKGDRFVLRDAGRVLTFGGGEVLDPAPAPVGRKREEHAELLRALESAAPPEALRVLVSFEGEVDAQEALFRSDAKEVGDEIVLGDRIFSADRYKEIVTSLQARLEAHHRDRPLEQGLGKETARAHTGLEPAAFQDLLTRSEDVADKGSRVALTRFSVELSPDQKRTRDEMIDRIHTGGYSPPLESELQTDPSLLRSLAESGAIVKIGDFYLSEANSKKAREQVRAAITERGPLTVAEIRDLLGTTRKYAVPLCEWLDSTGTTLRKGDLRLLGPNP